jgi:hypothetical protein
MQTAEETLFASRKTKEKNARSNYPRSPLKSRSMLKRSTPVASATKRAYTYFLEIKNANNRYNPHQMVAITS